MRRVGRLAFPIYCYLLVQGFLHTRSVPRYALRLFGFALLSELPFDLLLFGGITPDYQNVFWTLLIGLLTLTGLRRAGKWQSMVRLRQYRDTCCRDDGSPANEDGL